MKTVINIVLAACVIGLIYVCYGSIMGPINFDDAKKAREKQVIARLIDIRKAQLEYRNLHNGYLTLLAASGIVGFALILVFGVLFFIRAMQALFHCTDARRRLWLSVLIAACGAILASDLVNGCFVLWRGLQYIFLWLLLGEICAQITEPSPALTSPSGAE